MACHYTCQPIYYGCGPYARTIWRCVAFLRVVPEIVEDPYEVAVEIGGDKLAELPGFVLRLGNDLCLRRLPLCEEFVHLSLVSQIEPEKDRTCVAVGLAEGAVGDKQPAIPPGDARNAALIVPPIQRESQSLDVVG